MLGSTVLLIKRTTIDPLYLWVVTVQDVSALPTSKPHGGPITHSSTGSKPDSHVHLCFQCYSSCLASHVNHEPPSCTFVTLVTFYPLRNILLPNYLLPIISVLAENTLLKTACHFLLLLLGLKLLLIKRTRIDPFTCGSLRESWIRGCPDGRTMTFGRTPGL